MSSQTPEQCTHVCNFLFNCGSPLKCTLYSTHPRTEFLRLPSFYLGDHRPIIVVLYSKTILHKLLHKMWEVQIMSEPTLPSNIHSHLDHGKLYTSIFLFRFWHENLRFQPQWNNMWSRLSAHFQPFFRLLVRILTIFDKMCIFHVSQQKKVLFNCFATK